MDDTHCSPDEITGDALRPVRHQTWTWFDYLSFWMSDVHSVAGYMMAGALFSSGLSGLAVFGALTLGSLLVCLLSTLIAVPSQRYGIPFAILARAAFGVHGAMLPVLIRAIIAMVWYGIQTWLASSAILLLVLKMLPGLRVWNDVGVHGFAGLSCMGWFCFLVLWSIQMAIFHRGMETVRKFLDFAGPAVYVVMIMLVGYLAYRNGWLFPSLNVKNAEHPAYYGAFFDATALVVSYFSGPILNFGDFSRQARSMKDVVRGNVLGLPVNFLLFSVLAVLTILLTIPVFGEELVDPVRVVERLDNISIMILAVVTFTIATAGINIAANFISGALDLNALAPRRISWKRAGWLAGVGAILITPWNLYASSYSMHLTLDTLSAFIGPIFGIVLADFFLIRKRDINVKSLYQYRDGSTYWYKGGINIAAVLSVIGGASVALMPEVGLLSWRMTNFSWFVGCVTAIVLYMGSMWLCQLSACPPVYSKRSIKSVPHPGHQSSTASGSGHLKVR